MHSFREGIYLRGIRGAITVEKNDSTEVCNAVQEMLKEIGFQTIDDLFAHIPAEVKIQGGLNIPEGKTELEVRRDMENIAAKNQIFKTIFRGAGAYRHFIPATVKSVISKENLLTA